MGYPFIMVISEDTHTYYLAFGSGAVTTSFNKLGMLRLEFEHLTFSLSGKGERYYRLLHRRGLFEFREYSNSIK